MIFGEELAARERRLDLLREAREQRLALSLHGVREDRRDAPKMESRVVTDEDIMVRWGLHGDDEKVAALLEMNGMPRWVAFEERFVVAERGGEVVAALSYRTEPKRMFLGTLVVDPWAGERRMAVALFSGAPELAREMGVREIRAEASRRGGRGNYLREAGYRRTIGGWRLNPSRPAARRVRLPERGWRRVAALFGASPVPFHGAFGRERGGR